MTNSNVFVNNCTNHLVVPSARGVDIFLAQCHDDRERIDTCSDPARRASVHWKLSTIETCVALSFKGHACACK